MYESLSVAYSSVKEVQVHYQSFTGAKASPHIKILLNSPALLGREPVHPNVGDVPSAESTITFTLDRADIPRFHEALRGRGLVRPTRVTYALLTFSWPSSGPPSGSVGKNGEGSQALDRTDVDKFGDGFRRQTYRPG